MSQLRLKWMRLKIRTSPEAVFDFIKTRLILMLLVLVLLSMKPFIMV